MKYIISILSIVLLFSCNNSNKNDIQSILDEKIKFRGYLSSIDYTDNNILNKNWVDTFPKNKSLLEFLNIDFIKGKEFKNEIKIIDTDRISLPNYSVLNNEFICCNYDTTKIFLEIINNKKYLIIPRITQIGEYSDNYSNIFELIYPKSNYTKKRIDIDLPMWGLKIGNYIDKSEIETSIEKNNYSNEKGTIINQFLKSDKSIEISTLGFVNSNKVIITKILKRDLTETEFNNFIDYIKSKYPFLVIKKFDGKDNDTNFSNFTYTIQYDGLFIKFFEIHTLDNTTISFEISDSHTIIKRMIENEGKKFIYNESSKYIDNVY